MALDSRIMKPFYNYLDPKNKLKPVDERGLVEKAPEAAKKAYKEFQVKMKEIRKREKETGDEIL